MTEVDPWGRVSRPMVRAFRVRRASTRASSAYSATLAADRLPQWRGRMGRSTSHQRSRSGSCDPASLGPGRGRGSAIARYLRGPTPPATRPACRRTPECRRTGFTEDGGTLLSINSLQPSELLLDYRPPTPLPKSTTPITTSNTAITVALLAFNQVLNPSSARVAEVPPKK